MGIVQSIKNVFKKEPAKTTTPTNNNVRFTPSGPQSVAPSTNKITTAGGLKSYVSGSSGKTLTSSGGGRGSAGTSTIITSSGPQSVSQKSQQQALTLAAQNIAAQKEATQRDSNYSIINKPSSFITTDIERQATYIKKKKEVGSQVDVLRRGKIETFGGKGFFELSSIERRGTSIVTGITPFTNLEIAQALNVEEGKGIVLGERKQRAYDVAVGSLDLGNISKPLKDNFQSKVTTDTTPEQLAELNNQLNIEFQTEVNKQLSPKIEKIDTLFNIYEKEAKKASYKEAAIKALPVVAATAAFSPLIPAAAVGTLGLGLGGYQIAKTVSDPFSTITTIDIKKSITGEVIGFDIAKESYTPEATINLALGGANIGLGAYGSLVSNELKSAQFAQERISAKALNELSPTYEARFVNDNVGIGLKTYSGGKISPGSAKADLLSVGVTAKTGGQSFTFAESSVLRVAGEYDYSYSFGVGNKFLSVGTSASSGSGFQLPSKQLDKAFSISRVSNEFNLGSTINYETLGIKEIGRIESGFKTLPNQNIGKLYLGESTKLRENLFIEKLSEVSKLSFDTRLGGLNWAALTKGVQSRGIVITRDVGRKTISSFDIGFQSGTKAAKFSLGGFENIKPSLGNINLNQPKITGKTIGLELPSISQSQLGLKSIAKVPTSRSLVSGLGKLKDIGTFNSLAFPRVSLKSEFDLGSKNIGKVNVAPISISKNIPKSILKTERAYNIDFRQASIQSSIPGISNKLTQEERLSILPSFIPISNLQGITESFSPINIGGIGNLPSLGGFATPSFRQFGRKAREQRISPGFSSIIQGIKISKPLEVSKSLGVTPFQIRGILKTKKGKRQPYYVLTDL